MVVGKGSTTKTQDARQISALNSEPRLPDNNILGSVGFVLGQENVRDPTRAVVDVGLLAGLN
jgi:hypothetical protein